MSRTKGVPKGKFYDIGSGVGKAVFVAAMLHPFQIACGIEQLQGLSDLAEGLSSRQ